MLELRGIWKSYQGQPLLSGVSLTVHADETICLLGPSGSGKSTLLRIIAGLEPAESGEVLWEGKDLASTPAHRRDFGLVFQDYALFPHLDVYSNVAFGLRMRDWKLVAVRRRVHEVLRLVDLRGFVERSVTDLSGGEQQRVALARALAPRPRLLMFDEPIGALDRALREDLLNELRLILRQSGIPAIYVTHDQDEAFTIADRVLILHAGQIVRDGSPAEISAHPRSAWTARFLGLGNVIEGRAVSAEGSTMKVETPFGVLDATCEDDIQPGAPMSLLIRPEAVRQASGGTGLKSRVRDVIFQKDRFKILLENGLYFFSAEAPQSGALISVQFDEVECLKRDGWT